MRRVFGATPTPFHPSWSSSPAQACDEAGGGDGEPIPSGPLHDATEIGRVVPTAMIFAQSDPPISHAAIEDSSEAALERRDRRLRADRGAGARRGDHETGRGQP